ncbi:N-acetylmuramoyl-L-alanine amidase [Terribacillus sp. 179-K 1B1 HS]|uniref:N-acetylmuramoyl-L-alanine amidase n=1 Tax=Terribacillus sp. 179-K 1B1 HS TaxID=3142388 RepID=UPI0039A0D87B
MAYKVAICAGHGGNGSTPGKRTPAGEYEWNFNNTVVNAAIAKMKDYGITVLRTDDASGKTDVPLKTRTNKANNWGADAYVSVHHNANTGKWGDWTGVETYTYTGSQPKSEKLANAVHPRIVSAMGLRDRGTKKANLHIVRETKMPAILTEGGYMDSNIDIKKMRDNAVLRKQGEAIADGVAEYFGIKVKASAPTKTATSTTTSKPKPSSAKTSSAPSTNKYPAAKSGEGIVDYLKRIGVNSSFSNREKLAAQYGIKGYKGTASQNTQLLAKLSGSTKSASTTAAKKASTSTKASGSAIVPYPGKLIRKGSKGKDVERIQRAVNVKADGIFGSGTESAVKAYQKRKGLSADGIVGPATWNVMF